MSHGLMIPSAVAASQVDSYVRNFKGADDLDSGWVVISNGLTGTSGESEVFSATKPATGSLKNLWMVDGSGLVLTDSKYMGIDPNVFNAYTIAGVTFTGFSLVVGDIVKLTADCLGGTKGTNTFVVATNGDYKLNWAAAAISGVSLKLLSTDYVPMPLTGAIGETQRQTIYKFEVVAVA